HTLIIRHRHRRLPPLSALHLRQQRGYIVSVCILPLLLEKGVGIPSISRLRSPLGDNGQHHENDRRYNCADHDKNNEINYPSHFLYVTSFRYHFQPYSWMTYILPSVSRHTEAAECGAVTAYLLSKNALIISVSVALAPFLTS